MFEQAEKGLTLSDRAYETTVRYLRSKLLRAHFALRDTKRQVVVIVSGADGAAAATGHRARGGVWRVARALARRAGLAPLTQPATIGG